MKNPYGKPTIIVEPYAVDNVAATSCTADREDVLALIGLGYFVDDPCQIHISGEGPIEGWDTICYHSNAQVAFTS